MATILACLLVTPIAAPAATIVWADLGTNFNTGANWNGGAVPGSTDVATFSSAAPANQPYLSANVTVGGLTLSSGAGSISLTGAATRLTFGAGSAATITNASANIVDFDSSINLRLGQNTTFTNSSTGSITIGAALNTNGRTLTLRGTGAGISTVSGLISGSGGLTKRDSDTWMLTGANTYSGSTSITAGVLTIQHNTALGSTAASTSVSTGATLALENNITVAEALTLRGTGVGANGALRNLSGNNTWSGNITLGANSEIQTDSGSLNITGALSVGTTRTATFDGPGTTTVSGLIGTALGIVKNGAGTLALAHAANTYTGVTTLNAGTLRATTLANGGTNSSIGKSTNAAANLVLDGGALQFAGTSGGSTNRQFTLGVNGGTLDGSATGTGALHFTSTAAVTLSGTDTARTLTLSGSGSSTNASTLAAALGDNGTGQTSLVKDGTGTWTLGGTNTFTGATTINAGTLRMSAAGALSNSTNVNLTAGGAALDVNGVAANIGSLSGAAGSSVSLGGGSLTTNNNSSTIFSGVIGGAGSLAKNGTGTLTLDGANTYTGPTTINAGTIALGANLAINNTGALTIASGANLSLQSFSATIGSLAGAGTVDFGSSGTLNLSLGSAIFSGDFTGSGLLVLGAGSTLTLGASITNTALDIRLAGGTLNLNGYALDIGTLSLAGNSILDFGTAGPSTLSIASLTANAAATLTVQNWDDTVDHFYSATSPGTQGSAPLNQISFTGFTSSDTRWVNYDTQIAPVPESATWGAVLLGCGVPALAWFRARKRRRYAASIARVACLVAVSVGIASSAPAADRQLDRRLKLARRYSPTPQLVARGRELAAAELEAEKQSAFAYLGIGDSMAPLYDHRTALVVHRCSYNELKVGMIVVYIKPSGFRVAHMIVGEGRRGYIVQGIACDEPDAGFVDERNLIGRVVAAYSAANPNPEDSPATRTAESRPQPPAPAQGAALHRVE